MVTMIQDSGELLVRYTNNNLRPVSPEAATKVAVITWHVVERMQWTKIAYGHVSVLALLKYMVIWID